MGAEESKAGGGALVASGDTWATPGGGGCGDGAAVAGGGGVNFPNNCEERGAAVAWTLLHLTTTDRWRDGHAQACNFSELTLTCDGGMHKDCSQSFCIARQGFVNLSKASTIFSFRKRSKFYKMAEHFEYNHIPAQMSAVHHFRVMGVLCFRDSLVVLHLSRNSMDQLGLLDLSVNKFLGVFAKIQSPFMSPDRLLGALSPDKTKCLVRLPSALDPRDCDCLHLYDLPTQTLLAAVELRLRGCTHLVFNPRFHWQRAAVTNFPYPPCAPTDSDSESEAGGSQTRSPTEVSQSASPPAGDNCLSIVRLDSVQALACNTRVCDTRQRLYPYLRDLQYSRDGSLLLATLVDDECLCREKRTRNYRPVDCSLYVLDGETAQTLRCIRYARFTCTTHACPTNFTPLLSDCGGRLAVIVNEPEQPALHFVQVYQLPQQLQLQHLCRLAIRQQLVPVSVRSRTNSAAGAAGGGAGVGGVGGVVAGLRFSQHKLLSQLPLPQSLIAYLMYKPQF